ncbi:solute carrier family 2, facilitated glucose transporter member 1-like isoform X2 [Symsagittifera roscoffensis]
MYLAEIAPKSIRGGVGALFQLTLISGVVISFVFGFDSLLGNAKYWPCLFSVPLVFGVIQCFVLPFCVESPRFLLTNEGRLSCEFALRQIRPNNYDVGTEVDEIMAENDQQGEIKSPKWSEFIFDKTLSKPLLLAVVITVSQQFCGINSLTVYSTPLFDAALPQSITADDPELANYIVVGSGLVSFAFTALSVFLVDRIGRKRSHLIGLSGMAVCMFISAFLLSDLEIDDSQACHGIKISGSFANYSLIGLLLLYIAFFGIGPAAVPWLITPELFNGNSRSRGVSLVTTINWLCNFTVVFGFLPLQNLICGWVFLIFFILTVCCIVFLYFKLPEVRGGDAIAVIATNIQRL